jgi:hypothetical protein
MQNVSLEVTQKPVEGLWKRAGTVCTQCAGLVFKIIVFLVIANVVLFVAYRYKDGKSDPYAGTNLVLADYPLPVLAKAYPGFSQNDVRLLLHETWDNKLEFQPFVQFKERARTGKWVNVDPSGFRRSANIGPWPPDPHNTNIFVFGGSTAFGYGVPDNETIAAHLQDHLAKTSPRDVKVYNFGAGYYYSTQERVLFCALLLNGFVPDVAVFIDGLNDFYCTDDRPNYCDTLAAVMNGASIERGQVLTGPLPWLPMSRLARSVLTRFGWQQGGDEKKVQKRYDDPEKLHTIMARYFANKRLSEAAAGAYGVRPVFVWQPAPNYKYNLEYHFLHPKDFGQHTYAQHGYGLMAKALAGQSEEQKKDFLWLADIQEHATRSLYVDELHYNGEFSQEIARHIARFLLTQGICCGNDERQASAPQKRRTEVSPYSLGQP